MHVKLPPSIKFLPVGRNKEYLALAIDFAVDIVKGAIILRLAPGFMKL